MIKCEVCQKKAATLSVKDRYICIECYQKEQLNKIANG